MQVKEFAKAQDCLLPMGVTSENVAERFGVTREEQDQAAVSDMMLWMCFCCFFYKIDSLISLGVS